MRPYLPPLLAGGLARGDIGIDFDGTDFSFLESTAFLGALVAVGVVAFFVELWRTAPRGQRRGRPRDPGDVLALVLGLGLGALLFAGTLADDGTRDLDRPGLRTVVRAARLGRGRRA